MEKKKTTKLFILFLLMFSNCGTLTHQNFNCLFMDSKITILFPWLKIYRNNFYGTRVKEYKRMRKREDKTCVKDNRACKRKREWLRGNCKRRMVIMNNSFHVSLCAVKFYYTIKNNIIVTRYSSSSLLALGHVPVKRGLSCACESARGE